MTSSLSSHYEKFLATGEVKCIDEEIPFEIPQGWEWARFGNIANHSPQVVCEDNLEVAFMPMTLIDAGYRSSYTFEKRYWKNVKSGFTKMQKGDIAYAKITPCFQNRKSFILGDVPSNTATATTELNVIRIYADTFSQWYILYILKSDYFIKEAKYKGTAGQQRVLSDYVKSKLIPIPPRREQDRICNILHEVLPIVDNYDKSQSELDLLNSTISEKLKKSILQEAIQGKLVPQIPEEGTAQELLEQIRQEKLQLVKEGKLKKSAISDSIIFKGDDNKYFEKIGNEVRCLDDEIPFEIPDNWSWVRMGLLIRLISGTSYQKGDVQNSGIRILRGGNIQSNQLVLCDDDVFLPIRYYESDKTIQAGDTIIVASTGSPTVIGKPALINKSIINTQIGAFLRIVRPYISNLSPYIQLIFITEYYREHIRTKAKGTNINNIKSEYIEQMLVPIPTLDEQQRIIKRVQELFCLLK